MIAVVDCGYGNLRSVEKALQAAGGDVVVTSDPDRIRGAERVVVPGQGAFRDCMAGLRAHGLDEAVREKIAAGAPYLGICLGLQILFDESEEQGRWPGLGLIAGRVTRFPDDAGLKIPHMGWNDVRLRADFLGLRDGQHVYFVHSYVARPRDASVVAVEADYGGTFCAAVRRDNIVACQFHPEKSQTVGLALLRGFVGWRP